MLFQLVEIELNDSDQVIAETRTLPLFELHQDAMAMAEFAASRCHGDYGYDAEHDWWWACRGTDRTSRFVVETVSDFDAAA